MYKLLTLAAGTMLATAAFGQTTMTKETVRTKSAPAMTTVRHTTVTKTTMHRRMTNVPMHGVSFARAQQIALNARSGRIVSHRMDQERGGPAYSFNIRSRGRLFEVDVSRRNGAIVENRMKGRA